MANSIKQLFGLKITHSIVMNWVNTYIKQINGYVELLEPSMNDLWNADE